MNVLDVSSRPRAARFLGLVPGVLLLWAALYLVLMWQSGWPWGSQQIWSSGTVDSHVLDRFGSAVPVRIHQGQWQRILTGLLLHGSLLSLLMLSWWWAGQARTLRGLIGAWPTFSLMVLGGAAGAAAHALRIPESNVAAPGPLLMVVSLVGVQLAYGLFARQPRSKALLISSFVSIAILAGLQWYFTRAHRAGAGLVAQYGEVAMLSSLGAGLALTALLRPWRSEHPKRGRVVGALVLLIAGLACATQGQALSRSDAGSRKQVLQLTRDVYTAGAHARRVYVAGAAARRPERDRLHRLLQGLRGPSADALDEPDAERLRAYADAMQPLATGDVPDPSGVLVRCRKALRAWYEESEKGMRADVGLDPIPPAQLRIWDHP